MVIIQPALNLQPSCTLSGETFLVPSVFSDHAVTTKTIFTSQSSKYSLGKAIEKEKRLAAVEKCKEFIFHFENEFFVTWASRVVQGHLFDQTREWFVFSFLSCSFKGKSRVTRDCSAIYISDDLYGQPWHSKWQTKAWKKERTNLASERKASSTRAMHKSQPMA